jgi:5-methylcytosine-specific restriction endonuclease McrA
VRIQLFARDKGICATCGVDCVEVVKELEKLEGPVEYWTKKSCIYEGMILENEPLMARLRELSIPPHRYQRRHRYGIWDADHVIPVIEGGGGAKTLDAFRTLCCRCHLDETAKLKRRLAQQRKLEKGKPISKKLFE